MTEQEALVALNGIPGVGNAAIRDVRQYLGSVARVFALPFPELLSAGIPAALSLKISEFDRDKFLKNEYNLIKQSGVRVLTCDDQDYPELLREIPDAPAVLYSKGDAALLKNAAVAVVGSRRCSVSGMTIAEKFGRELSERGITIVSGMARGIDTASHRGALRAGGTTVAVVGSGLANIYPPENKDLFEAISRQGVVLSEFPMQSLPLPHNFPRRNRIISGLSLGVIVVEAAQRSGALVTARMALEQGREVFAVPGSIDRPTAQGVNELIKQGAKLVTCVDDILEELVLPLRNSLGESQGPEAAAPAHPPEEESVAIGLSQDEQAVYDRLPVGPVHVDDLLETNSSAMGILLRLELKHLVKQLPGKMFTRVK